MSFQLNNFGRSSVSANAGAPRVWNYNGIVIDPNQIQPIEDTLVIIKTVGYFDQVGLGRLAINDLIYIVAVDGEQFVKVMTITPSVVVQTMSTTGEHPVAIIILRGGITAAGNLLSETFAVPGMLPTDSLFVQQQSDINGAVIVTAGAGTNEMGILWDQLPGMVQVQYQAIRNTT